MKTQLKNQNPLKEGTCEFKNKASGLTVGDVFHMRCEWPASLNLQAPFQIQTDKDPYALVILQALFVKEAKGEFKVTSWRPGTYNQGFVLQDKKGREVKMQAPLWKTTSVLKSGMSPPAQPYPPYGPWKKEVLSPYVLGISVLCVLTLWGILKWWIRRKARRESEKIKAWLKDKDPYDVFLKELAFLSRKVDVLTSFDLCQRLKDCFVFFLQNMFKVKLVKGDFKSLKNRLNAFLVYNKNKTRIHHVGREIESVLSSSAKLKPSDARQLIQLVRRSGMDLYYSFVEENKTTGTQHV